VKHPEIILLPPMMFADYFLTVLGAIQRDKKYARHFKMQHYELNPIWQKSISRKKWFNLRHTLLVVIMNAALIWALEFGDIPDAFAEIILGSLLVVYGVVIGRHFSNLLIFRYIEKNSSQISGEVSMSHRLVLSISTYQMLVALIPVVLIAVFSRSNFARGGVLGAVILFATHWGWRRNVKPSNLPPADPATPRELETAAPVQSS
jgi:hypothetical protein